MKTMRIAALLTGMVTITNVSCKKTDLSTTQNTEEITGKTRIVLVTGPSPIEDPDCWSTCIDPGGPYVESSGYKTQTWGSAARPHWKTVNHVAYNTPTSFIVEVTFTHSGGNASNTVSVTALGSTQSITTLASDATHTFTFTLPAGWNACDNVPFTIYQEGQNSPINISASYRLYGVCVVNRCETLFTGEAIACTDQREAVYTFTATEGVNYFKIQGGLANFTGTDAIVEVTGGTGITISQWTPGGSSNRVIKVEGSASECETITIRITWSSTNSGGVTTGSWSVKDANGVDIAAPVEGLTCN